MTKDELTDIQAEYAESWAQAIRGKCEADLRRGIEMPLGYYLHDGIRRILADLGVDDPRAAQRKRRFKFHKPRLTAHN